VGKAVVPWKEEKEPVVRRNGDYRQSLFRIGGVVVLGQHDALWIGCGTGGIANIGHIIPVYGFIDLLEGIKILLEQFLTGFHDVAHVDLILGILLPGIHQDNLLQQGELLFNGINFPGLTAGDHHHSRFGVLDAETQVGRFIQLDGDGYIYGSQVEHPHLGHHPPGPALGQKGEPVPFAYPQGHQSGCELVYLLPHRSIGGGTILSVPFFPHVRAVLVFVNVLFEELNQ